MGRQPTYGPEKQDEIISWIAQGKMLREYCRIEGNPAWRTVYHWLHDDPEFAARFAHARDLGEDAIAQECLEIADEKPEFIESEMGSRRDPAMVAWAKNRIETRLKLLAKWNPKKWGEKLDVSVTNDIAESLEGMRRRRGGSEAGGD